MNELKMMKPQYPWKRRWLKLSTPITYDSRGFATSKSYSFGQGIRPKGLLLSQLEDVNFLVLLGEPGLGKSTEIEKEHQEICQRNSQAISKLIRLNSRSSEEGLINLLDKTLENWQSRGGDFYLFLDGLDEGLLILGTIFNRIAEWVEENERVLGFGKERKISTNEDDSAIEEKGKLKFYLRLSCRSAIWREEYTLRLNELFDVGKVNIFELGPLEQEDVRLAAETNNVDPDLFIDAVSFAGLPSLASNPISLEFLFAGYQNGILKQASYDKSKIYFDGLVKLCDELNPFYNGQNLLFSKEKLLFISRLAVYSVFSNLPSISKSNVKFDEDNTILLPDHVSGDSFKITGETTIEFSLRKYQEVVNTAVFSLGSTESQLSWKHRTYSEFLAAWHLHNINMPLEQLLQLFGAAVDPTKISPQFYEVVLWLASFNKEYFDKIVMNEPLLMLRLHRTLSDDEREIIVKYMLQLASNKNLAVDYFADTRNFGKLNHKKLADQLRPFIKDKSTSELILYLVLSLAASCRIVDLKNELIEVFTDKGLSTLLRRLAMESLSFTSDSKVKEIITPYALEQHSDDVDDELKGQAISSLYPKNISTEDLFLSLTKPKKGNLIGSYIAVLSSIAQEVPEDDLGVAIKSILQNDVFFEGYGYNAFGDIVKTIIQRAWVSENLSKHHTLLAKLIIELKRNNIDVVITEDEDKRREVVLEIIMLLSKQDKGDLWLLESPNNRLIQGDDWHWLSQIVRNETFDYDTRQAAGYLLVPFRLIYDPENNEINNALINLANEVPWFGKMFSHELLKCDRNSVKSERDKSNLQRQRQSHQKQQEWRKKNLLSYDPVMRSIAELESIERGNIHAWVSLLSYLGVNSDRNKQVYEFQMDVRELPVWGKLSSVDHERIINAAIKFLADFSFSEDEGFGTYPMLAGYKAIYLISAQNKMDLINPSIIVKWMPIVIYFNILGFGQKTEVSEKVINSFYEVDRSEFLEQVKKNIEEMDGVFHLDRFNEVLKHGDSDDFLSWLLEGSFDEQQSQSVFNTLAKYKPRAIVEKFKEAVIDAQSDQYNLPKLIDLSVEALNVDVNDAWIQIWPFFQKNAEMGKRFLSGLVERPFFKSSSLNGLLPKVKADLLVWLYENFPTADDPEHNGGHLFKAVDHIVNLRGQLLGSLIHQGTIECFQALQFFIQRLPAEERANRDLWLMEAKKKVVEKSFTPIGPWELRNILQNGEKRLVRSSEELLKVILESLKRFQDKLKGNNPISYFLWDKQKNIKGEKSLFLHKDENSFSDFVKMHLDYDLQGTGIIVNREVEIKKSTGIGTGERTDIFIQVSNSEYFKKPFTVVVEAKGCWNPELETAMETQLVGRYLEEWKSDCGIFLVGWFHGDNFDVSECPHKEHISMCDLESFLEGQAKSLSTSRITVGSVVLDCRLN